MGLLKDNKIILIFILVLAFCLRLWNLYHPNITFNDGYLCTFDGLNFKFDFFNAIKNNTLAPLYCFYLKLWQFVFKNSEFALKLSSLIPNFLGCLFMYFAAKNYQTKKHSIQIGLASALIASLSSFLICFCGQCGLYSLTFMLCCLVLLFSIKMYEFPCKKNALYLTIFSVLLILCHTIAFVYVIFNTCGLIAFHKRKKKDNDYFTPVVAGLLLCVPVIPFLFRIFAHPTYISRWWSPFEWSNILFFFTDLFSPVLKNITNLPVNFYHQIISNNSINIGFVVFALLPAGICLFYIIGSIIDSKRINKYFFCVFLASFLTILISAIVGKLTFLTKYLIELYPISILLASIGWAQTNSKNVKISLATIYIFMTLFFIIVSRVTNISLLG